MASVSFQTNGGSPASAVPGTAADSLPTPSAPSQPLSSQQPSASFAQPPPQPLPPQASAALQQQLPAPRPRDVRTMELLLTAQGVTAYEARVPQLLLDFAYRHTSAILSDALHLSADPYTSHAGARPSATSGATASVPPSADASVSANAIRLAVASRLAYQFRGGGAAAAAATGGPSKEWLLQLARERNRVALPKVGAVEWGTRLPSERFVLSGVGWGLRDAWAAGAADDEDDDEEAEEDEQETNEDGSQTRRLENGDVAMGGVDRRPEDVGGDGVEGGTMEDVFEDDGLMEDEEMGM